MLEAQPAVSSRAYISLAIIYLQARPNSKKAKMVTIKQINTSKKLNPT